MQRKILAQATRMLAGRLDELAGVTDDPKVITRTFLSPAMGRANLLVGAWMKAAGLAVREDPVGNLVGRREGPARAKTLLLGSHLDTVRDAGRFDGPLGVLLPLSALEVLRAAGAELPFAVEVVGFSEEEGVRFSSAYIGSKGFTGRLARADLGQSDPDGITVGQVLAQRTGGNFALPRAAHRPADLLGYVEVHIEQGPVLEAEGLAAGVVSAIAGQTRAKVVFTGKAGHAGTTPMALRRDALAAAAEFVLAAERLAQGKGPLVATVGRIVAQPGAANVIPGRAELTLDVRHPSDRRRRAAFARILAAGRAIARRRRVRFSAEVSQDNGAAACSKEFTALLTRSVRAVQGRSLTLPSGAGHDGVVLAAVTPVAMLFVRCRGGLSHHPDEYVRPRDLGVALQIMVDFLGRLAAR